MNTIDCRKFGLEKRHIDMVLKILNKNVFSFGARYYIYGERATGNYQRFCDINIAIEIEGQRVLPSVLARILLDFSDSTVPYKVNVVDLNAVDKDFRYEIEETMIEI